RKNGLNRLIRGVYGRTIGPDPRNFNQRASLGRNDLLIRTFPNKCYCPQSKHTISIGIDHSVLIAISSTINNRENKLQDLLCDKFEMNYPKIKNASIFPDGTIFGMIDFRTATPDFITL
ncbi:hypothetical protein, partial [Aeromonas salmonicida]|uniref:hypothetical protein n=1 Tax=Aeromonas salmonicida TaxID=645 RepID=UPI0038CF8AB2